MESRKACPPRRARTVARMEKSSGKEPSALGRKRSSHQAQPNPNAPHEVALHPKRGCSPLERFSLHPPMGSVAPRPLGDVLGKSCRVGALSWVRLSTRKAKSGSSVPGRCGQIPAVTETPSRPSCMPSVCSTSTGTAAGRAGTLQGVGTHRRHPGRSPSFQPGTAASSPSPCLPPAKPGRPSARQLCGPKVRSRSRQIPSPHSSAPGPALHPTVWVHPVGREGSRHPWETPVTPKRSLAAPNWGCGGEGWGGAALSPQGARPQASAAPGRVEG